MEKRKNLLISLLRDKEKRKNLVEGYRRFKRKSGLGR